LIEQVSKCGNYPLIAKYVNALTAGKQTATLKARFERYFQRQKLGG
jgi:hypothetical protein